MGTKTYLHKIMPAFCAPLVPIKRAAIDWKW